MREPARDQDALDDIWIERFHADAREDERNERRLLLRSLVIAAAVALLTLVRWRFL